MVVFLKRVWLFVSQLANQAHYLTGRDRMPSSTSDPQVESPPQESQGTISLPSTSKSRFAFLTLSQFQKTLVFLGAVGLLGVGLWMQRQEWVGRMRALSWGILVAGLVLIVLSSRTIEKGSPPRWLSNLEQKLKTWLGVRGWQVICLVSSPILAWVAYQAAGDGLHMVKPVLAVTAWISGIVLAVLGGWQFRSEKWSLSRQTAIILGLLVFIAIFVRGYNITRAPLVLTGDEAGAGLAAVDVLEGFTNNIFRAGWFSFPAMHSFFQAVPIALFGQTIQALRSMSVLAGVLTVGGVYLAAREMFGERTALFSAIFLATFNFHTHFSRIGLNNIWDGLWFLAVLGLLWHGWRFESRRSYLLAGLALGFSQYFYVGVRIFFLLIPLWIFVIGLFERECLKRSLPDLLLMILVALTVLLPLAFFYLGHPEEFMAPVRRVSIFGGWMANEVQITGLPPWRIVLHQIALSLQGFAHIPLRMWYQPGTPLLRLIPAVLFFVGLGLLLRKPRDDRTILLLMWILVFGIMNGFSEGAPAAQRYVAVAPAVAILVGYGLAESGSLLSGLWPRYRRIVSIAALAFMVLLSLDELRFYFQVYTPQSDLGGENTLVAARLADYLRNKSSQWEVAFFGSPRMGYYSIASLPYLAPHIKGYDMNHPWGSLENPQLQSDYLIFVFLPGLEADLEAVQNSYPGGELLQETTADGRLLYWLYEYATEEVSSSSSPSRELVVPYPYPYPLDTPTSVPEGYP